MPETSAYSFRPLAETDFGLIRRWLREPHVRAWWDEPEAEFALIAEDSTRPVGFDPYIVSYAGRPLGYLQCYDVHAEDDHPYADQPPGTCGIDQFIGEPDLLDRGHGARFIRAFADLALAQGAPRVVTDPDPANGRAIAAYGKAGFRPLDERDTPWGRCLLMARDPD